MSQSSIVIELKYQPEMIAYYHSLSDLEGFTLLESIDKRYGRYDIVTALPYDVQTNVANPFFLKLSKVHERNELPFQGGVIAALSYEYGRYLQGLCSIDSISDQTFNCFQFFDWGIVVDHVKHKTFLYARNTRSETSRIVKLVLKRWRPKRDATPKIYCNSHKNLITTAEYKKNVLTIQEALREGRCYQVNYTQPYELSLSNNNPWDLYRQIRQKNPVPFAGYLNAANNAIVSFSPERYLGLTAERKLFTSPIKGSIGRDIDPLIDKQNAIILQNCPKNSAENIMIVDLLRNDLSRLCNAGSVQVNGLKEIQSFPSVHHLVSHVSGTLKQSVEPLEALLGCFPGGSITGAPKLEAMKMISESEPYPRGMYCGSLAYISSHGRMDSNIAIRTLQCQANRKVRVSAGGGIVLDSDWEEEYAECNTKILGILKALYDTIPAQNSKSSGCRVVRYQQ